jgi:UDP-N-acetylmuramyl pentapeptide phosphotransferase/UDP-N-acetylglucosamine-1-phosphate transferase
LSALIPLIFFYENLLKINDLCLIISVCLIGFWDDKRGLSQKLKLIILFLIGVLYIFSNEGISSNFSLDAFNYILVPLYFIFIVLFFNQIDGINGLAAITFIVTALIMNYFLGDVILIVSIFGAVLAYLLINIKGSIGIQGEAGSFFMGAVIFILSIKVDFPFHNLLSFIFLLPKLLDVSSTTIVRYYLNINLLKGHRYNLYQKLVAKYQRPGFISLIFGLLQLIIGCFIILGLENLDKGFFFLILFIFILILTLVFLKISLLIHSKKLLDY